MFSPAALPVPQHTEPIPSTGRPVAAVRTRLQRSARLLPAVLVIALALVGTVLSGGTRASGAEIGAVGEVRGPDVSGHQHPGGSGIDWGGARAAGAGFALVKASEGVAYTNPFFHDDFAALAEQRMIRGAYHYARPSVGTADAVAEARHFVAVAGTLSAVGDLPPVLDLERADGLSPAELIAWTAAYLEEVTRLTGRTPMIYTYPDFWRTAMDDTSAFNHYPLWIATYGPRPILVGGWSDYTFWQYTDRAPLAGMPGPVDMSVFAGSTAELAALADPRASVAGRPAARITGSLSAPTVALGGTVTLSGSTVGLAAGETLYRQGYWSGSWHTWATTTVSATGAYTFAITPTNRAVNRYRVYAPASADHPAVATPALTLDAH